MNEGHAIEKLMVFNINEIQLTIIGLLIAFIALLYPVIKDYLWDRRNPDKQLINYFKNVKLSKQKIIKINENREDDELQGLVDELINSYKNDKFSLFVSLMNILNSKWDYVIRHTKTNLDLYIISDFFCEHYYRRLIDTLIEKNANRNYLYPALKSFSDNIFKIFDRNENIDERFTGEILFYASFLKSMIIKSIEENNSAIFRDGITMLEEQLNKSIQKSVDDSDIESTYVSNLREICESICAKEFDDLDFFVNNLMYTGRKLISNNLFFSFENILNIFNTVVDFELEVLKNNSSQENDYHLIYTLRNIIYIWCKFESELPEKSNEQIMYILERVASKENVSTLLITAFQMTQEWLEDEDSENSKMNLHKLKNKVIPKYVKNV